MDKSKSPRAEKTTGSRRITMALLLYSLGFGLFGIVVINDLLTATSWQVVLSNSVPIILALIGLVGVWLVRRGRSSAAGWLIIVSTLIGTIAITYTTSGYWFILVSINLVFAGVFADLTLPRKQIPYAIGFGLTASVLIVLIEFYWSFSAVAGNPDQIRVATWLAAVLLTIYLINVLSRFSSYSLRTKLILVLIGVALLSGGVIAVALQVTTSRNLTQTLGASFASLGQAQGLAVGDLIDRQLDVLGALAADEFLADAVNSANKSHEGSLDEIRAEIEQLDQEWRNAVAADELAIPLIQSRVNWSPLSPRLRNYRDQFPDHIEIFVTDRTGALVAATNVTSDYNQADEDWWQAAFNAGRGGVYIGEPEYDESAGDFAINLAVQVRDPQTGILLGVLRSTYRLSALDKLLFGERVEKAGETDLVFSGQIKTISPNAQQHESNDQVRTIVASTPNAIGYLSLGFLDESIVPIAIDGAEPTVSNINNGSYLIFRPLNMITNSACEPNELAVAFIKWIVSEEGRAIVAKDYVTAVDQSTKDYTPPTNLTGRLQLAGSTTIQPLVENLADAFKKYNPNLIIEIKGGGSSEGITSIGECTVSIGNASRAVKISELNKYPQMDIHTIAYDIIAIVVNPDMEIQNLRLDEVRDIFAGDIANWSEIGGPDAEIVVVSREESSGTRSVFDELVMVLETQAIHEGGLSSLSPETMSGLRSTSDQAYTELDYEGVPNLIAQAPVRTTTGENPAIDDLGWVVVLHQPVEVAMVSVAAQTRLSVLLVLLTIGVVSAGAVLLSQFISGPIVRLAGVAEEVGGGNLAARARVETEDEIGDLAQSFNSMTGQLQTTLEGLEQRVAERTRAIELSADVSRRLSTILDPAQLVSEVVELLQSAFDYYHVHIYLFDDAGENLVMAGGTGEAGKTMLERGHKIAKGKGLVGRAGESGQIVLVANTTQDPDWLPNPLLPETKAEIAVPILLGDEVLGALDVQEDEVGSLDAQDADLLTGIAGQVAIALRNSQQYAEAQQRAGREAQISAIVGQIQSTQTVEEALQIAVRELGRALKTPKTQVRVKLGEDENGNGRDQ